MELLGIAEDEPDPFGGHYERVPGSATLTGEVHGYAEYGVRRQLLSFLPDADLVAQYRAFAHDAVRLGFTSLQDMAVGLTRQRAVAVLRAADLPLRVRSMCFPLTPGESCEVTNEPGDDDALLTVSGVKWITDGTPVERLALAPVFAQRFTPAVFAELEPLRALLDEGIPLALGTDGIGAVNNPFVDLFLATIHPTHPSEALTITQAVSAYTRGSAYAEFEEHRKGTLTPGRLADLAVLSQDIFHAPPPAIPATQSVLTMVNGVIVWDAGVLTPAP